MSEKQKNKNICPDTNDLLKQAAQMEKEIKLLNEKLEKCDKERKEFLAGWQRARADFLNYKKCEAEKIGEVARHINETLILKLLPVLDNLELAEKNLSDDLMRDENIKGILQIKSKILDIFKDLGVEEIKSLGEKFDPNFHEAVEMAEEESVRPGEIVREVQKGYKLHNKVIRAAKVKVAK